ncbi:hypothetical protein [Lacticaseibacillus brantae]|uniref:Uncharacterized protein n=1 Tax=Lacticaseibacillus brantae DSM 23927 TaxID=1423727 RepID=A0A0R2AWT6_9LACO|nr:hypothetical protein [Lacticaseibacillus brantae]KRM71741.1 hypothetical protein FC34_GL001400 [Lacticaseibacillus brantae DSM 23927]
MNRLKRKTAEGSAVFRKKLFKTKKGWMMAGVASLALAGTMALGAPQSAHAAVIDVSIGQTTHADNNTTIDRNTAQVESNAVANQAAAGMTDGKSNLNADGVVSADNVTVTNNQRNITVVGKKDDGLQVNVGGSAQQQVVTQIPTDLKDHVALVGYDNQQTVTDSKNGNLDMNPNYQQPKADAQGNYQSAGQTGQAKVTVTINAAKNQAAITGISDAVQKNNVKVINAVKSLQEALNGAVGTLANPAGSALNSIKSVLKNFGVNLGDLEALPSIHADFNLGDVNKPGTVTGELAAAMKDLTPEALTQLTKLVNVRLVNDNKGGQYVVSDDFSTSVGDAVHQHVNDAINRTANALDKVYFTYTPLSVPELKWAGNVGNTLGLAYNVSIYSAINAVAKGLQNFINADNDQVSLYVDISGITKQNKAILGQIPLVGGFVADQLNNFLQNLVNTAFNPLKVAGYAADNLLNGARNAMLRTASNSNALSNLIGSFQRGTTTVEIPMVVTNPDLSRFSGGTKVAERFGLVYTKDHNFVEAAANSKPFDTTSLVYEVVNKTRDNGSHTADYQAKGQTNPNGLQAEIELSQKLLLAGGIKDDVATQLRAAYAKAQTVYADSNATQAAVDQAERSLEVLNLAILPTNTAKTPQVIAVDPAVADKQQPQKANDHKLSNGIVVVDDGFQALKPSESSTSSFAPNNDYTTQQLKNFKDAFATQISGMLTHFTGNGDAKYITDVKGALKQVGFSGQMIDQFVGHMNDKAFWDTLMASPLKATADLANSLGATVNSKLLTGLYKVVNPVIVSVIGTPLYSQPADSSWDDLMLDDGTMPMNMDVDAMMRKQMTNLHWEKSTDLSESRRVVFDLSKLNLGLDGKVTLPDNFAGNTLGDFADPNFVASHPDQVLADLLSWMTGQPIKGLPVDENTGYLVGFLYNQNISSASGVTFPTLNALIGGFVAGLSGNTVERTLGMLDDRLASNGGNRLVAAMATLGDTIRQLIRFDFPDVANWLHDGVFQFIQSAKANSTAGGPSVANTDAPTAAEYNKKFMNNKEMAEMQMYLLSALSVNNFANFLIKTSTSLVGSVVGIATSAINGFIHPGEQTPGGQGALLTAAGKLGGNVSAIFDTIGSLVDGALRTILGEAEHPILSDEPDRLVFGTLASVVTGVNSVLHGALGLLDSAGAGAQQMLTEAFNRINGITQNQTVMAQVTNAVQQNDVPLFHRLLGVGSSVIDATTDLVWNAIASVLNISQLIHPHGFSNLV